MNPLLLLSLATGVTAAAEGPQWVHFADCGAAGQQRSYWYDSRSVRSHSNEMLVQIRGDYSKVMGIPASNALIVWSVDCAGNAFSERRRTEYRADGDVAAQFVQSTGKMPIHSGSVAARLAAALCK